MRTRTLSTVASLLLLASTSLMSSDMSDVFVREEGGVYRVTARFLVAQAPGEVLAVLTDYERIPRFMPDVKKSLVHSRHAGRAVVEQEAQRRVLMFSKRVHLLLDIQESADALTFVDTSGRSFTEYRGSWRTSTNGPWTQVEYQLDARPAFDVPPFVLMRLLRGDATQMIARLRDEIAARSGRVMP